MDTESIKRQAECIATTAADVMDRAGWRNYESETAVAELHSDVIALSGTIAGLARLIRRLAEVS